MPTQVKARKPAPKSAPEVEETVPAPSTPDVLVTSGEFLDEVDALLASLGELTWETFIQKGGE